VTATAAAFDLSELSPVTHAVACEARNGLTRNPKSLAPWLFYDEAGSDLFEKITNLPEYYLTRTERTLFEAHSAEILCEMGIDSTEMLAADRPKQPIQFRDVLTIAELGAGTASKSGILLRSLASIQPQVLYHPIDVSESALSQAKKLETEIPGVFVRTRVANYVAEEYQIERAPRTRVLTLYIGSSIGNFAPDEACSILGRLCRRLKPGDGLLLGTDLAPGPNKSLAALCGAYDDAQGITAAFNRNILVRLNRELETNFAPENFGHLAIWNEIESRMEMHLRSLTAQIVTIPANSAGPACTIEFKAGETIHTENSYKFTRSRIGNLLVSAGFHPARTFVDRRRSFALTLAKVE
jgi:dimethylhistidine N-methyltransferase